ncbi:MAG: ECF-type sigma factor [Thermoanaerobaculia bacterium]|nr:ECF-type sigma factor [Thermoanaerobaculia bacterium]
MPRPKSDDVTMRSSGDVTRLIREWRAGDARAQDELFESVYDDLRRLAASYMRNERLGHTLPPTGLVHEAFLRMRRDNSAVALDENRRHFFAVAARAMRRILVEHARHHGAARRPSSRDAVPLDDEISGGEEEATLLEILEVDGALDRLRSTSERQAQVVELRYFAGLGESEVADVLGVSRATISRDWRVARMMLKRHLRSDASTTSGIA